MPRYPKWSAAENALLKQLVDDGAGFAVICEKLSKGRPAIESKLRRLGIRIAMPSKFDNNKDAPAPKKPAKPRKSKKAPAPETTIETAPETTVETAPETTVETAPETTVETTPEPVAAEAPAPVKKRVTKKKAAKAPSAEEPDFPTPIKLWPIEKIGPRGCLWPIGDLKQADFRFCGDNRAGSRPYCLKHMKMAVIHPASVRILESV